MRNILSPGFSSLISFLYLVFVNCPVLIGDCWQEKIPVLQHSLAFQTWWNLIVGNVHILQFGWVVVLSYAGNCDSHHHHDCNLTSHLGILSLLCWYHCDHLIIILIMTWSPYFLTLLMMSSGWWVWWWSAQMPEENEILSQCVRCLTLCCPSDCQFQTADAPAAIAGGRTNRLS